MCTLLGPDGKQALKSVDQESPMKCTPHTCTFMMGIHFNAASLS